MTEWTFEGAERHDLLPAINLLCNAQDAERRERRARFRDNDTLMWEMKLEEARYIYDKEPQ